MEKLHEGALDMEKNRADPLPCAFKDLGFNLPLCKVRYKASAYPTA
jgi:hypothetical protein